jgi:predicted DNA-binding protein with PD1-like motif
MRMVVTRLREGQDLRRSVEQLVKVLGVPAATVISGVGSLNVATLRMAGAEAGKEDIRTLRGPFEIVSLIGNLGPERSHLHMAVSDADGQVIGGHVKDGCEVHTTVELTLAVEDKLLFGEELDSSTGYGELSIRGM